MSILVTGGAGYIGSVIVHKLLKLKYDIIVVDKSDKIMSNVTYYQENIGNEVALSNIFRRHEINQVIHCAGYIDVKDSMENPIKYFYNNIGNFCVLLKVMELYNCFNIIFSSTCATYGNPVSVPITELHPQNPINNYGWTKLICEQMLIKTNFNYVIFRYFNVAGSYIDENLIIGENHKPETHLIPLAITAAINNKPFNVYGTNYNTDDGTCIRDYIHVEDLADAHILCLGKTGIYNLGSEKGYSVKHILDLVQNTSGTSLKIINCDKREGDADVLYASSDKFKNEFGWTAKHDISSIILSAYKWHKLDNEIEI